MHSFPLPFPFPLCLSSIDSQLYNKSQKLHNWWGVLSLKANWGFLAVDDGPLFLTGFNSENIPSTIDCHSLHILVWGDSSGYLGCCFWGHAKLCFNLIQWAYQRCICGMYVCVYVGIIGDFGKMVPMVLSRRPKWFLCIWSMVLSWRPETLATDTCLVCEMHDWEYTLFVQ
jgi:hypothetical protein